MEKKIQIITRITIVSITIACIILAINILPINFCKFISWMGYSNERI